MTSDPAQRQTTTPPERKGARRISRRFQAKTLAAIAVAALLIALGIANNQKVEVHFLVGTRDTPLVIVIAIVFVLGFLVGMLIRRRSRRPRKR